MQIDPTRAPDWRIPLLLALTALAFLWIATACNGTTSPDPGIEVLEFDFTEATHGWVGGFSDFPPEWEERMELESGHEPLPAEVEREGRGLRIAGSNNSDDLFMFWKGRAEGLRPDAEYLADFEVEFATEAPSGCAGIGGPPGEAVTVKVGATPLEPRPVIEEAGGQDYYRMNIDKGNQSSGGDDALVIGDVASTSTDCNDWTWEMKTLASEEPFRVTTDSDGALWLLVGTDSGFEGRTRLFYTRYSMSLEPSG